MQQPYAIRGTWCIVSADERSANVLVNEGKREAVLKFNATPLCDSAFGALDDPAEVTITPGAIIYQLKITVHHEYWVRGATATTILPGDIFDHGGVVCGGPTNKRIPGHQR